MRGDCLGDLDGWRSEENEEEDSSRRRFLESIMLCLDWSS